VTKIFSTTANFVLLPVNIIMGFLVMAIVNYFKSNAPFIIHFQFEVLSANFYNNIVHILWILVEFFNSFVSTKRIHK